MKPAYRLRGEIHRAARVQTVVGLVTQQSSNRHARTAPAAAPKAPTRFHSPRATGSRAPVPTFTIGFFLGAGYKYNAGGQTSGPRPSVDDRCASKTIGASAADACAVLSRIFLSIHKV